MTTDAAPGLAGALLDGTTRIRLRPCYEGADICTWIGFKHVDHLVEEAVLAHFRGAGAPAGALFFDDRVLRALAGPVPAGPGGGRR
jgi:hypothetical protein